MYKIYSRKKKKYFAYSNKVSYSSFFDTKIKNYQISNENRNLKNENSSRILSNKTRTLKEKDIETNKNFEKSEKATDSTNEANIISKIELNQFKPKFCYKKKREHFEKILLEEGMKIILKKLDVQNLFKKIYKDNPEIEEKNDDSEYIEMSENCKKELRNVIDGRVRTLVI